MEESRNRNKSLNGKNYLEAAKERLKEAEVLKSAGSFGGSVARSYYAFLDTATATLTIKDIFPNLILE